jgi:hypothetical protein
MLNLLIAIMADSYERVKEAEVVEARKLRAQTILNEERLMSKYTSAQSPTYLQVLQATDIKDAAWSGLSGKVGKEVQNVTKELDIVKQQVAQVKQVVEDAVSKLEDKLDKELESRKASSRMPETLLDKVEQLESLVQVQQETIQAMREQQHTMLKVQADKMEQLMAAILRESNTV